MKIVNNILHGLLFIYVFCVCLSISFAGQFITEDPVPIEYEHYEINPCISETKVKKFKVSQLPAAEMNVGVYPEFQAHLISGALFVAPPNSPDAYGYEDTEIGLKYRFIQETDTFPQVGFYPKLTLPSGDAKLGTGVGGMTESVPLWFLKSWGSWKLSGGGGYTFSQAPHTFNFPFGGLLLQRGITEALTLGGELYSQGKSFPNYRSTLIFTYGGNYNFTKEFGILFSVGHSIAGERVLTGYIGLDWVLGPSS
ncbi:MAG: transporter [Proteobacteria bacterium]|nr:transporter [Pseudomonadota bacterium]